ncbi:MAG TPA: YetF domain-containing protein [Candidatus Limnocylindrales bacterium]|nr:YetF domain-containing protein [Candidatus Limnocylindrales bacterium]
MNLSEHLLGLAISPLELVIRTSVVYLVFMSALRLAGKRELGQFTLFDIALVVLAANALQPAVTGPDNSLTGGVIILVTIFGLNGLVAQLRRRVPFIRGLMEIEPRVIGRDGHWIQAAVDREGLDESDLSGALRKYGVEHVGDMRLATLEEDGTISIVPRSDAETEVPRRRRRGKRRQG